MRVDSYNVLSPPGNACMVSSLLKFSSFFGICPSCCNVGAAFWKPTVLPSSGKVKHINLVATLERAILSHFAPTENGSFEGVHQINLFTFT
jgi:hypothetical protein